MDEAGEWGRQIKEGNTRDTKTKREGKKKNVVSETKHKSQDEIDNDAKLNTELALCFC